jgi:hypothetical protein
MRAGPIIAVAIATGLLLTGCTAVAEPQPTASPIAEATSEPVPEPSATEPEIEVGTVVATGTLTPVLGAQSGEVVITALGGNDYSIELIDYVSDRTDEPDAYLWPDPPGGEVDCSGNLTGAHGINEQRSGPEGFRWRWYFGSFNTPDERGKGDPAHMDALVLRDGDSLTPHSAGPRCLDSMTAYAPLTWALPVFHEVPPVGDGGPREGAQGTTTSDDTGLLGYVVAEGDDSRAVAQRFGLAMEDFVYLNPNLGGATDHPNLRPGSTQALRAPARS